MFFLLLYFGFFLMIPAVILITKDNRRRGALLQATFRSNFALIGIPLAQSIFGDEGVIVATLLSAVVIPVFNVLAVVSLSIFSSDSKKTGFFGIILNILKNPLIQSIFIGLICLVIRYYFVEYNFDFRFSDTPFFKVIENLSKLATPLALLVLGAQFEFSSVKALRKEIIFGTIIRTVAFPILCIGCAIVFFNNHFNSAHIAVFIAVFASPVAVSSVPMAQEMKSDSILAGQLVIWTTIVSAITVFIYTFILKSIGIF